MPFMLLIRKNPYIDVRNDCKDICRFLWSENSMHVVKLYVIGHNIGLILGNIFCTEFRIFIFWRDFESSQTVDFQRVSPQCATVTLKSLNVNYHFIYTLHGSRLRPFDPKESCVQMRCRQGLEIHGTSLTSLNECHFGPIHLSSVMGEKGEGE